MWGRSRPNPLYIQYPVIFSWKLRSLLSGQGMEGVRPDGHPASEQVLSCILVAEVD